MNGARGRKLADEIVARLRSEPETPDEVFTAFAELDALPEDVVRDALEPWLGSAPDVERLDDATRAAHGFPARKLRLRTLAIVKDADVLFLGSVAEEQLRVAGRSWDGADLEPEERLDEETEHSFAGTLEHHTLAGADDDAGTPLFEVVRFLGDAGVIFRAGTVVAVGYIADGRVESADARIRAAVEDALRAPPPEPIEVVEAIEPVEEPPKKVRRAKSAPKKTAAKTAAKTKAKRKTK